MNLYSYDIASAYPYHASKLVDLRDCTFSRSTSLDNTAYYGFLVGDFTVYPDSPLAYCSPFITDRGDGTPVNFTGTVHDYPCLLDEVRFLSRYSLGEFKLKYGWLVHIQNGVRPRFPFKLLMEDLYSERSSDSNTDRQKSELRSYLVKRVMNGLIGKMLEVRKDKDGNIIEYGELYNPIYHALCTTRTRLQVFEFIVENGITREELVHIGVDGVRATKYLPLPKKAPMGKWRCSSEEQAAILSPGAVLTADRNFKRTGYVDFVVQCLSHPSATKLGVDGDIDLKNLWMNQNRVFPELPKRAGDLLERKYLSEPVEL